MIDEILITGRICPLPTVWNKLYKIMCKDIIDKEIPKPLILGGWNLSSDFEKNIRFREHLQLIDFESDNRIKNFVLSMEKDDWYIG